MKSRIARTASVRNWRQAQSTIIVIVIVGRRCRWRAATARRQPCHFDVSTAREAVHAGQHHERRRDLSAHASGRDRDIS